MLPEGLGEALDAWLHTDAPDWETGPLAVSTRLQMGTVTECSHEVQVHSNPAPRLVWSRGDEVMLELAARRTTLLRHLVTGREGAVDCTLTGAVWRMTEQGWRATDSRHGERWASAAMCLRHWRPVERLVRVQQIYAGRLHVDSVLLAVSNPSETATVTCACDCATGTRRFGGPPAPETEWHFRYDLPRGGSRVVPIRVGDVRRATGTRISVWRTGLEEPGLMVVPFSWHGRLLSGRQGWCRHSVAAASD